MPENDLQAIPSKITFSSAANQVRVSSANTLMGTGSELVFSEPDRMELPKDYTKLIKLCRFFYKHDPIAGTVLNKMVDCAITPLRNRKSKCTDVEYAVYRALEPGLQEFFRNACLEYLLSGLLLTEYEWVKRSGNTIRGLAPQRKVWLPDNFWFRDPATIQIKPSFLPNRKNYYVKVDTKLIQFIKENGKAGIIDGCGPEEYKVLVENYPEFVTQVKASKSGSLLVLLPDADPMTGRCLPDELYPIPYMTNALESLMHKRNMRQMDYAIAARVTSAIQLIKMGNDDYPVTSEDDFNALKARINSTSEKSTPERLFQLFTNHTVTIEWVYPNTEAMLNDEKYRSIDNDVISAFGFPRSLITGETLRSNVGGEELASFSPLATMEGIRDKFVNWTAALYEEIRVKNDFKNAPIPKFEPIRLYKLSDLNKIGESLYKEGSLSRTSRLESQGYDLETEVERLTDEREVYEQNKLEPAPAMPFSSPNIGNKKAPTTSKPVAKPTTKPPVEGK